MCKPPLHSSIVTYNFTLKLASSHDKRFTHMLQEEMQLWETAGIDSGFKQRHKNVLQHLLEVRELLLGVVHITAQAINHLLS